MNCSKRTFLRSILFGVLCCLPITGFAINPSEPLFASPSPSYGYSDCQMSNCYEGSSEPVYYRGQVNYSNQNGYYYYGPNDEAYQPYDYYYPYRGYSYYPYQDYYQYYNYNWGW